MRNGKTPSATFYSHRHKTDTFKLKHSAHTLSHAESRSNHISQNEASFTFTCSHDYFTFLVWRYTWSFFTFIYDKHILFYLYANTNIDQCTYIELIKCGKPKLKCARLMHTNQCGLFWHFRDIFNFY